MFIKLNYFQFLVTNITSDGWFHVCLWVNVCQSLGCSPLRLNRKSASYFQTNYGPGITLNLQKSNTTLNLKGYYKLFSQRLITFVISSFTIYFYIDKFAIFYFSASTCMQILPRSYCIFCGRYNYNSLLVYIWSNSEGRATVSTTSKK